MATKEEYLKRYLSGGQNKEKKKKKKLPASNTKSRFRIVDDDVDVKALIPGNVNNTLEEDMYVDKPTVADVIDERPKEVQILEKYRSDKRWKVLDNENTETRQFNNRTRHDSVSDEDISPHRKRHDSDLNESPPRRKRHDSDLDESPPHRKRYDSDLDESPPRRKRHDGDLDESPQRRKRHNSDLDESPPRRKRPSDSAKSPPCRRRQGNDSDTSPPRKKRHDNDSDKSPPRRKRQDSDSDKSPPRRKRQDSDDKSPPRRRRKDNDSETSPVSRERQENYTSHSRLQRKRQGSDSDSSPHRKRHAVGRNRSAENASSRDRQKSSRFNTPGEGYKASDRSEATRDKGKDKKMKETLGGAKAGLSSAKDVKDEIAKLKKKEDDMFDKLDASVLGKNAKTVFRDKTGRKRNLKEEEKEQAEKAKKQSLKDAKYNEWGKGLAQKAQQEANVEMAMHEMSKPLTRYKDDEDLDAMLKDQDRAGDPMLAFMKNKKKKADGTKTKALPRYSGPQPPPNRFNIWPGYRWDGVNRTNGFEKKLMESKTNKKAIEEIAYKWSTEDM